MIRNISDDFYSKQNILVKVIYVFFQTFKIGEVSQVSHVLPIKIVTTSDTISAYWLLSHCIIILGNAVINVGKI